MQDRHQNLYCDKVPGFYYHHHLYESCYKFIVICWYKFGKLDQSHYKLFLVYLNPPLTPCATCVAAIHNQQINKYLF